MKNDLRFTYRFAPDVMPGENPQSLATIDPSNPHRMEVPFEGSRTPATQFSIAAMPGAPEEGWIAGKANVPMGKVNECSLKSVELGSQRKLWVYTPAHYNDKEPGGYRLVVLFDGFSYLHWIPIPTVLDNLLYAGKAPLEDRRFDRQSAGVSNVGTAIQLGIRAVLEQGITAVDS
jgi:hypothetical protein